MKKNKFTKTSYWAGAVNSSSHTWGVITGGYFVQYLYHNNYQMGVRPVITIPKNIIG